MGVQGWLFHEGFWTNERIRAYLSGVPDDRMIVLDLNSEATPVWQSTESYFGKPFAVRAGLGGVVERTGRSRAG